MFSQLSNAFKWIGEKTGSFGWFIKFAIVAALGAFFFGAFNGIRSCQYDKANAQFQARDKARAEESAKLKARAEASEARAAELEPKVLAYEKLADDKKRLDESITTKIDDVIRKGQEDEANTNTPTDCWTRADRTCAKFHALKPPIELDCDAYKRKLCAGR